MRIDCEFLTLALLVTDPVSVTLCVISVVNVWCERVHHRDTEIAQRLTESFRNPIYSQRSAASSGQSKLTAEDGQLTACLPNRALEFQTQQARSFDGKLHRQLQEDVLTKTVDDERDGVLLRDAALHQVEQLLFADARSRRLMLNLRAVVHYFDIGKSIRARVRTN